MATVVDYECRVRILPQENQQPKHIIEESLHESSAMFPVKFFLAKVQLLIQSRERLVHSPGRSGPRLMNKKVAFFPVTDHSLLDHIQDFKEILTVMGIPANNQSDMLQEIESVARSMDSYDGVYMEVKMLEWNQQEIILPHVEEDQDTARAERESMEVEARPIPATKSSIDALERTVFDGLGSARDCTVCMEEIEAGSEAIRMPCWHVYHSGCIVQWLRTSHLCPLCPYHMPCEF
ncbi:unnamed protein product [Dovyalis caffra]|uniref:RING-type domain-containing protein n=1 Tax=Dovyalis caffra TaxID=77055 RepID=A0AAV1S0P8_9ROSI|nr:unnamed protein product [Dovyalis caffra]